MGKKNELEAVTISRADAPSLGTGRLLGMTRVEKPSSGPERFGGGGDPSVMAADRSFVRVKVSEIHTNPFNARKIYTDARVDEMAASLKQFGQQSPGIATERDGKIVLIAGEYRLRGLKRAGIDWMLLELVGPVLDTDLYHLSLVENERRNSQTTLDTVLVWQDLLEKGVFRNQAEIAEKLKMSEPQVSKLMGILRLPDDVLEVVKGDPESFSSNVLIELVNVRKRMGELRCLQLAEGFVAGSVCKAEIFRLSSGSLPAERRKVHSRQYKLFSEGTEVGKFKEWDGGRVEVHLKVDEEKKQKLFEFLKVEFQVP